jgi:hypothetical protein
MKVTNLCEKVIKARCFVFGVGFGEWTPIPGDLQVTIRGPRRGVLALSRSPYYEFDGDFLIVQGDHMASGDGILQLFPGKQIWYDIPGACAYLHVWYDGELPEESPPAR